jgi:hypothetical protein
MLLIVAATVDCDQSFAIPHLSLPASLHSRNINIVFSIFLKPVDRLPVNYTHADLSDFSRILEIVCVNYLFVIN